MASTMKPPASQAHITPNADPGTQHRQITSILARRGGRANPVSTTRPMPTVRQLLSDAHRTMFSQSRQLRHDATAMDVVLDHRLLIGMTDLPAEGRHRSSPPRNHGIRCWADVDAYWAQQETRVLGDPTMSQNIEAPTSAVRFTTAWPPNLDGDEVWDFAS